MSKSLKIKKEAVEIAWGKISGEAEDFELEPLTAEDNKSTLQANQNSKTVFNTMEKIVSLFDETLTKDAQNIRSLGVKFDEFDQMTSKSLTDKFTAWRITK